MKGKVIDEGDSKNQQTLSLVSLQLKRASQPTGCHEHRQKRSL